jgi:hypothetical protein
MSLLNLLKEPTAYRPGGGSKELKYKNPPLLGHRVTFNITDDKAEPTFVYGLDHSQGNSEDVIVRGGLNSSLDRRRTDRDRISKFIFDTPIGKQWLAKQVATQTLNKYYPQVYNLGVNTLQSVQLAGLSNVERGGVLSLGGINAENPITGDFNNENPSLGNKYEFKVYPYGDSQTYERRELHYKLGDPGKKDSIDNVQDLINSINPFSKEYSYDT